MPGKSIEDNTVLRLTLVDR